MDDGHAYWNDEGGQTWLRNMDRSEANFVALTRHLPARAAARPGEQGLDVGCGGGQTRRALAQAVSPGSAVPAVDISEPILRVARQRHGALANLAFLQADAGGADLGTARFDLLFSRFGVMFFADPAAAFGTLRRAVKPKGERRPAAHGRRGDARGAGPLSGERRGQGAERHLDRYRPPVTTPIARRCGAGARLSAAGAGAGTGSPRGSR